HARFVDQHPPRALAGDFLRAEIGPAPAAGRNVLPVGIFESHDGLLRLTMYEKSCPMPGSAFGGAYEIEIVTRWLACRVVVDRDTSPCSDRRLRYQRQRQHAR